MKTKTPEKRIVNLEDDRGRPDLAGLVEHVGYSYLRHSVEIRRDGQTVAVLLDPEAARCALAVAQRFRDAGRPSRKMRSTSGWMKSWKGWT